MAYIDLHSTLNDWPYDPEQISVRKLLGADGGIRIQMRVELGVLQMETTDRPDGLRPHGRPSLLDYHHHRLSKHEQGNGTTLGFQLTPDECQELRQEASLYYRRYVALFVLEEFVDVIQDTRHNLGIFDICRDYAAAPEDRSCLESFRPYVMMMETRARAYQALQEDSPGSALAHVNRGILQLQSLFAFRGDPDAAENSDEMKMLRSLSIELSQQIPQDTIVLTRRALRSAIAREEFEEAARLRDALKNLYGDEEKNPAGEKRKTSA